MSVSLSGCFARGANQGDNGGQSLVVLTSVLDGISNRALGSRPGKYGVVSTCPELVAPEGGSSVGLSAKAIVEDGGNVTDRVGA